MFHEVQEVHWLDIWLICVLSVNWSCKDFVVTQVRACCKQISVFHSRLRKHLLRAARWVSAGGLNVGIASAARPSVHLNIRAILAGIFCSSGDFKASGKLRFMHRMWGSSTLHHSETQRPIRPRLPVADTTSSFPSSSHPFNSTTAHAIMAEKQKHAGPVTHTGSHWLEASRVLICSGLSTVYLCFLWEQSTCYVQSMAVLIHSAGDE